MRIANNRLKDYVLNILLMYVFGAHVYFSISGGRYTVLLARFPDDPQGIRVASVIEFSYLWICLWICLCVGVFWANFLISGHRHVIVARVTIEFAAGMNLKTHYQTNCN